jgi:hypothetical protein
MMYRIVPLSWTVSAAVVQFALGKPVPTCGLNPVEGEGQYIMTVFVLVRLMPKNGWPIRP